MFTVLKLNFVLGEKFLLCSENNGQDNCSSCGDGYFTALSVDTALVHIQFDPCMKLKCSGKCQTFNKPVECFPVHLVCVLIFYILGLN